MTSHCRRVFSKRIAGALFLVAVVLLDFLLFRAGSHYVVFPANPENATDFQQVGLRPPPPPLSRGLPSWGMIFPLRISGKVPAPPQADFIPVLPFSFPQDETEDSSAQRPTVKPVAPGAKYFEVPDYAAEENPGTFILGVPIGDKPWIQNREWWFRAGNSIPLSSSVPSGLHKTWPKVPHPLPPIPAER